MKLYFYTYLIFMSKLDNNLKMIISKYLFSNDFINLINTSSKLNTYFHTTFNYINLDADYVIPKQQIKNIINKLLNNFPNLEEIILNITSEYIYINNLNCIMENYKNLNKYLNNNFDKNIKIKFNFNQTTNLNFHNINNIKIEYYLDFIKNVIKSTNNLYIIINLYKINDNNLLEFANKYKTFKFVKIIWIKNIHEINNNSYLKLINKYKNIYYTNVEGTHLYHHDISILDNPYLKCHDNHYKISYLLNMINNFELYYNIMKLKRKLKNEPLKQLKIKYELDISYYTEFIELNYENLKRIFNNNIYIDSIYYAISNATHITFNDELFIIRNYYIIEDTEYIRIDKKETYTENMLYMFCKSIKCKENKFNYFKNYFNPMCLIKDIKSYWKINNDLKL